MCEYYKGDHDNIPGQETLQAMADAGVGPTLNKRKSNRIKNDSHLSRLSEWMTADAPNRDSKKDQTGGWSGMYIYTSY